MWTGYILLVSHMIEKRLHMQWYEDLVGTMGEAVNYLADDLQAGNILTEASRQMLADFSMAMELCADRLAREDGILTEKCRRYAPVSYTHLPRRRLVRKLQKLHRIYFSLKYVRSF